MKQLHSFCLVILIVGQSIFGQDSDDANLTEIDACNGDLTCLESTHWFDFAAQTPENMNLTFKLFTIENHDDPVDLQYNFSAEQIEDSPYDSRKRSIFIIHGFMSGFKENGWTGELKNKILDNRPQKYNVFCVDWSGGTSDKNYARALKNVEVVGSALATFIGSLMEFTLTDPSDVHLIGHSLGSHIAGLAGRKIRKRKIYRITGLDPAGPWIRKTNISLKRSDAKYVDIVHSDNGGSIYSGFGIEDPLGLVDFYPNGGADQPGCSKKVRGTLKLGPLSIVRTSTSVCDHAFAHVLIRAMPEDMPEKCQFVGVLCMSYAEFKAGLCGDCGDNNENCWLISLFGFYDPELRFYYRKQFETRVPGGKYYFNTLPVPPFCLYHYVMAYEIKVRINAAVFVEVHGSKSQINFYLDNGWPGLKTQLFTSKKPLGPIKRVVMKSRKPYPRISIQYLRISFLSNINPNVREEWSAFMEAYATVENGSQIDAYPII